MRQVNIIVRLLHIIATVLALVVVLLGFGNRNAKPVLLREDPAIRTRVGQMLRTVCDGRFSEAGKFFYGSPELAKYLPDNLSAVDTLLEQGWSQMDYTMSPSCYLDGQTLALNVTIRTVPVGTLLTSHQSFDGAETVSKTVAVHIALDSSNEWKILPEKDIMDALLCWITVPIWEES